MIIIYNNKTKEFNMTIAILSEAEASNIDFNDRSIKTKYPWYTTKVNGVFFIPEMDVRDLNSRPTVPEKLARTGYKIKTKISHT